VLAGESATARGARGHPRLGAVLPAACVLLWTAGAVAAGPGDAQLDRDLLEIRAVLDAAHFRTALAMSESLRPLLANADASEATRDRRARLEVMVATAEVALGRSSRARAALTRALEARPDLVLDERRTSPKLVALWRDVRAVGAVSPGSTP